MKRFATLEKVRQPYMYLLTSLSNEQLNFKPAPNEWNILQVCLHLATAERLSYGYVQKKMGDAATLRPSNYHTFSRNLMLKLAMSLPIRFKVPLAALVPQETANVIEVEQAWNNVRQDWQALLSNFPEDLLRKEIFKHPRAGMLNILQALDFMEAHVLHHLQQIHRIKQHAGFPK